MKKQEILAFLEAHAPISSFYLQADIHGTVGLVCYVDAGGKEWSLMIDDDSFCIACIECLAGMNVPILHSEEEISGFVREIKRGAPGSGS